MSMDPNLVVLAGGVSSRMRRSVAGATDIERHLLDDALHKSKSMIRIGAENRPLMDYVLYNAQESGYHDVVIVIGEHDTAIREYYSRAETKKTFRELRVSYAVQPIPEGRTKPLGTADALLRALYARPDWYGQYITVCNSDNIYSTSALRLLLSAPQSALIDYERDALQFEQSRIEQFAVIRKDHRGYLTAIVEKPTAEELAAAADPNGRVGVSMNIFRLLYDTILPILETVPLHPVRQEKEIPRAIMTLLEGDPMAMVTIPLAEYVPDLTSKADIPKVQEYLTTYFPHFGSARRDYENFR